LRPQLPWAEAPYLRGDRNVWETAGRRLEHQGLVENPLRDAYQGAEKLGKAGRLLKKLRMQGRRKEETGAYWVVREDFRRPRTQQMDFFSSVLDVHPDPGVITAIMIVEVVDERALAAVGEHDAHEAHPAVGQGRPLLHHLAVTPFGIPSMGHPITEFQKQSPRVHPTPFT
jgi:hypothetical protein